MKIFGPVSLQEANASIPMVQKELARIHDLIAKGQALYHICEDSDPAGATNLSLSIKGDVELMSQKKRSKNISAKKIELRLKRIESNIKFRLLSLQKFGASVKNIFPAHVAFLTQRHCQPVYLSWQFGEKSIQHWHGIDEHFENRKRISKYTGFDKPYVH